MFDELKAILENSSIPELEEVS